MFWNTVTGSVIGLLVAGSAYFVTGRRYIGDSSASLDGAG
jgi:hypothetical protein